MFRGFKLLLPLATVTSAGSTLVFPDYKPIFRAYGDDSSGKPLPAGAPPRKKCIKKRQPCCDDNRSDLEKAADICRREYKPLKNAAIGFGKTLLVGAQTAVTTISDNIQYLQKCADPEIQGAAILGAGVVGMLFGYRRRLVGKIFYGLIGAGAMYSIIFPKEAAEISKELCVAVAKITADTYHSIAGDRPPYKCPDKVACPKKECAARARREGAPKDCHGHDAKTGRHSPHGPKSECKLP